MQAIPDFYIEFVAKTKKYPKKNARDYVRMGIFGELGEIASILKKAIFNEDELEAISTKLTDEIGDLVWYLTAYGIENYCSTMVEIHKPDETYYACLDDFRELFESVFVFSTNLVYYGSGTLTQFNLSFIFEIIIKLLDMIGCELEECLRYNMNKVNSRIEQGVKQFGEKYE